MLYHILPIRADADPMVKHLDMAEAVAMVILQQTQSNKVGQPCYPPRTTALYG